MCLLNVEIKSALKKEQMRKFRSPRPQSCNTTSTSRGASSGNAHAWPAAASPMPGGGCCSARLHQSLEPSPGLQSARPPCSSQQRLLRRAARSLGAQGCTSSQDPASAGAQEAAPGGAASVPTDVSSWGDRGAQQCPGDVHLPSGALHTPPNAPDTTCLTFK